MDRLANPSPLGAGFRHFAQKTGLDSWLRFALSCGHSKRKGIVLQLSTRYAFDVKQKPMPTLAASGVFYFSYFAYYYFEGENLSGWALAANRTT
jgi:hypothetical protein